MTDLYDILFKHINNNCYCDVYENFKVIITKKIIILMSPNHMIKIINIFYGSQAP